MSSCAAFLSPRRFANRVEDVEEEKEDESEAVLLWGLEENTEVGGESGC
jgi:hypothetical protein